MSKINFLGKEVKDNSTVITVAEYLKAFNEGLLIREPFQRTPSHTQAKAKQIVESAITRGFVVGMVSLALTEQKKSGASVWSIVDGSSRLKDFADAIVNDFKKPYTAEQLSAMSSAIITIHLYTAEDDVATMERRSELYTTLNDSVSLSGAQKYRTGTSLADMIVKTTAQAMEHAKKVSARQKQSDISYKSSVDMVLLAFGKYNPNAKKQGLALQALKDSVDSNEAFEAQLKKIESLEVAITKVANYLKSNGNACSQWNVTIASIVLLKNPTLSTGAWINQSIDTAGINSLEKIESIVKDFTVIALAMQPQPTTSLSVKAPLLDTPQEA